mgnify:FL=1
MNKDIYKSLNEVFSRDNSNYSYEKRKQEYLRTVEEQTKEIGDGVWKHLLVTTQLELERTDPRDVDLDKRTGLVLKAYASKKFDTIVGTCTTGVWDGKDFNFKALYYMLKEHNVSVIFNKYGSKKEKRFGIPTTFDVNEGVDNVNIYITTHLKDIKNAVDNEMKEDLSINEKSK